MSTIRIISCDSSILTLKCRNVRFGILSLPVSELQAIWHGLHLGSHNKWHSACVLLDPQRAVDICNSKLTWNSNHGALVHQIQSIISATNITVSHIAWSFNECAHWLAQNGLFQTFGLHDFVYLPFLLMHFLRFVL